MRLFIVKHPLNCFGLRTTKIRAQNIIHLVIITADKLKQFQLRCIKFFMTEDGIFVQNIWHLRGNAISDVNFVAGMVRREQHAHEDAIETPRKGADKLLRFGFRLHWGLDKERFFGGR